MIPVAKSGMRKEAEPPPGMSVCVQCNITCNVGNGNTRAPTRRTQPHSSTYASALAYLFSCGSFISLSFTLLHLSLTSPVSCPPFLRE